MGVNRFVGQRLSNLKSVTFSFAQSPVLEDFLEAYGSLIEEVTFAGTAAFGEVFLHAPNLRRLQWDPRDRDIGDAEMIENSFSRSDTHKRLQKIVLLGVYSASEYHLQNCLTVHPPYAPADATKKEHTDTTSAFFHSLNFAKFPSLKKIEFPRYVWPTEE